MKDITQAIICLVENCLVCSLPGIKTLYSTGGGSHDPTHNTYLGSGDTWVLTLSTMAADHNRAVENVFITLSSESPQTQGMAMVLANTMVDEGATVDVLLCDAAGDIALAQGYGTAGCRFRS